MEFSPAGPKKFRGVWFLVLEFGLAAQGPRQFRTGIPREKAKEKKAPPPCQGSQLTLRPSPATHEGPHPISTHHRRQRRRNTAPRHRSFTAPQVARICPPLLYQNKDPFLLGSRYKRCQHGYPGFTLFRTHRGTLFTPSYHRPPPPAGHDAMRDSLSGPKVWPEMAGPLVANHETPQTR